MEICQSFSAAYV